MLANGQDEAEIRAKMDIPADVLAAAEEGWWNEAKPLAEADAEAVDRLIEQDIGGFIALTMARVDPAARREFSDQVLVELAEVPYTLVVEALAQARRKVSFPERLVPFIFDFVEARAEKLRVEGDRLERLARIARGGQD